MQGYIKDYRKEIESDVWLMPPLYHRTWQWLKYNVNHEEAVIPMRDGTELHIKRGQRLTSVRDLAKAVGWYEGVKWKEPNPKTMSGVLDFMVKKGMIEINQGKGNRQYTLITLMNWEVYNPKKDEGNSKVTPRTTVSTHPADINNNDLNVFNDLELSSSLDPFRLFETEGFGTASSIIIENINDLIKTYTDVWVCEAMKVAVMRNKRSLSFTHGILKNWKADGIDEPWKGGQDNEKHKGLQPQGSARESEGNAEQGGWLPSKYNTDITLMPKVSGQ